MSSKFQAIGSEASIKCSLKLFTAGKLEVEKIQVGFPENQGTMSSSWYSFPQSPLCDAAISALDALKHMTNKEEADHALSGIGALLTVWDRQTQQLLFVLAMDFYSASSTSCQTFRLTVQ